MGKSEMELYEALEKGVQTKQDLIDTLMHLSAKVDRIVAGAAEGTVNKEANQAAARTRREMLAEIKNLATQYVPVMSPGVGMETSDERDANRDRRARRLASILKAVENVPETPHNPPNSPISRDTAEILYYGHLAMVQFLEDKPNITRGLALEIPKAGKK